jgi:hypothetical protein
LRGSAGASAWLSIVLERRQDSGGEFAAAAAVYELEQRMQVIPAVASQRLREANGAADFAKSVDPPREDPIPSSRWISLDRRHAH